jgi:hypothetical protein
MTTDTPCKTKKRCFSFESDALLIAGIKICRVGMVDMAIRARILALNKLLFKASIAAMIEVMITKI